MRISLCLMLIMIFSASCALERTVPAIVTDRFATNVVVDGIIKRADPILGISRKWYLKSFIDKNTGHVTYQLYVSIAYVGSWKSFDTAVSDIGRSLPVRQVDPAAGSSCDLGICDTLGVELSTSFLLANARRGFAVKLSDDSGDSMILDISPEMITDQLTVSAKQAELYTPQG